MKETYSKFEFHYASISLSPYKGDTGTSSQLLKEIIQFLNSTDFPNDKRVIDRHKNRKNSVSRRIVNISSRIEKMGQRCFGKVALIKNKAPMLWSGKDIIEEIEKEKNKQFIEVTNYVINFNSGSDPVIMFEHNYEGPRLSDIEYYFRQIAKEYKLAKNIKSSLHLYADYDTLDKKMINVFGLTVKVNTANINKLDWHKDLKHLESDSGFKDIRLEFIYKRVKKNGFYEKNIRGLDFARGIVNWLKKSNKNIEYVDDLKMTYQLDDDKIVDLDFLKNKITSFVKIPLVDSKVYKAQDFRHIVGQVFNHYLQTGDAINQL